MRYTLRSGSVLAGSLYAAVLLSATAVSAEPATDLPPRPPRAPGWSLPRLSPGRAVDGADRAAAIELHPPPRGSVLAPSLRRSFTPRGISRQLIERMQYEVRRFRKTNPHDPSGALAPEDSVAEQQRAREAERVVTRALNRTLDRVLEEFARTTLRLAPALDWVDELGGLRPWRASPRRRAEPPAPGGAAVPTPPRHAKALDTSLGLKLDARPKVVFRARFLHIAGKITVPLLDDGIRFSFERSLGAHGRAALTGAVSGGERDWAALMIDFRF
ncbi:MAG: hypothetical protein ACE5JH_09665 [Acidobacteriota bacterium]